MPIGATDTVTFLTQGMMFFLARTLAQLSIWDRTSEETEADAAYPQRISLVGAWTGQTPKQPELVVVFCSLEVSDSTAGKLDFRAAPARDALLLQARHLSDCRDCFPSAITCRRWVSRRSR